MRRGWADDLMRTRLWQQKQIQEEDEDEDEDEEDCVILDGDPNKPSDPDHQISNNNNHSDDEDELVVVAEKGQIACRDYPHPRHLCVTFPFNTIPHEKYCDMCHCYVCDTRAPCFYWGTGKSGDDHCHSTDKEEVWRDLRRRSKEGKLAQLQVPSLLETTPSNINEERVVELDLISLALDQSVVKDDRLTGIVKWFDSLKGYGFITREDGGADVFVHHSSIKFRGHQSLAEGERVEFAIAIDKHGRGKAIDVSGLGGSLVQGTSGRDGPVDRIYGSVPPPRVSSLGGFISTRKDNYGSTDTLKCYKCQEIGHLARNCTDRGGSSDNNFRARAARGGGGGVSNLGESFLQEATRDGDSSRNSDTSKCYNCGEFGHLTRNCDGGGRGGNLFNGGSGSGRFSAYRRGELGRNTTAQGITREDRLGNWLREREVFACTKCGKLGHSPSNCEVGSDTFVSRGAFASGTNRGRGHTFELSNNRYSERNRAGNLTRGNTRGNHYSVRDHHSTGRGGGGCYICGKPGHQARDCFKERGSGRSEDGAPSCTCGNAGHLPDCAKKHDRGGGGVEVPCFTCHKPGHSPMDCPKKHQIWRELHYGF